MTNDRKKGFKYIKLISHKKNFVTQHIKLTLFREKEQ